jgi:hypothetical protein
MESAFGTAVHRPFAQTVRRAVWQSAIQELRIPTTCRRQTPEGTIRAIASDPSTERAANESGTLVPGEHFIGQD